MRSILIVEDNEVIIKGLTYLLEKENFHVIICKNVYETMNVIGKQEIHLIVLDIALPDGNGFELCEYIKKYTDIPVIFLTAKDEEQDVVKGLDLGAEDYIIKPFRNRELLSRINNVLKRFNKEDNKIVYGSIKINLDEKTVYVNEESVEFTALEFKILVLMFTNIGKVITREQILEKIKLRVSTQHTGTDLARLYFALQEEELLTGCDVTTFHKLLANELPNCDLKTVRNLQISIKKLNDSTNRGRIKDNGIERSLINEW